ncbi:MAG: glycerate kinase [Bacillota bacterium]|nr:glycerate kinase [Bacillota bacterium]
MKILIAPDSFKGSLSSEDICKIGKKALEQALDNPQIDILPIADGGEGTVASLVINTNGKYVNLGVKGPYGEMVNGKYGILGDGETAVIEMSNASGLAIADNTNLNPLKATSYGTGEMILDAVNKGCRKFIIGIGGSATNDCGIGMLQALGFKFQDKNGDTVPGTGESLGIISKIDDENVLEGVLESQYLVACDVDNPLTGPRGATMVYGPQKGADEAALRILEDGMIHFGDLIENYFGKRIVEVPGAGAAGGMGAALYGFLGAELKSGFEIIKGVINLDELLEEKNYDVIFTGEGQMDHQTLMGKLVLGISSLGKKYNIPVIAICGSLNNGWKGMLDKGLTAAYSIVNKPMTLGEALVDAEEFLYDSYYNVGKILKL